MLDFGTMGMGEKRDIYFAILNKNPIAVTLRGWGANLTGSLVEVIGVDQGNETEILERASFEGMTRKLIIPTGHYLIFRLGIHTTEVEGAFDGYVYVETSYHTFKVKTDHQNLRLTKWPFYDHFWHFFSLTTSMPFTKLGFRGSF